MKMTDMFLELGRPVAYYPKVAMMFGGDVTMAIYLAQLIYWSDKTTDERGFYKTKEEIEQETGMGRKAQDRCRAILESMDVLKCTLDRLNHRMFYKLHHDNLNEVWSSFIGKGEGNQSDDSESPNWSFPKVQKGRSGESERDGRHNRTENTTYKPLKSPSRGQQQVDSPNGTLPLPMEPADNSPASCPDPARLFDRARKWFKRRPTTPFDRAEERAIRKHLKNPPPEEDLQLLDWWFSLPYEDCFRIYGNGRRKTIAALFNNLNAEIEKAAQAKQSSPERKLKPGYERYETHPGVFCIKKAGVTIYEEGSEKDDGQHLL
jgi:hypothetical protein